MAVSPYTCLTTQASDRAAGAAECLVLPTPKQKALIGPWLLAEAKQALADLRERHPRAKDLDTNLAIGLSFAGDEAHVVPQDDAEADVIVNPKFLIDGLGRWPASVRWHKGKPTPICLETTDTRYWIACMVKRSSFVPF